MGSLWAELRNAIAQLNTLFDRLHRLEREIRALRQELRDARGR